METGKGRFVLGTKSPGRHLPGWFLRFAFHLLYYQLAWTYDLVAWLVSFGQWAAWRRTATLFLREGPILELAYGTGGLMVDLSRDGLAPIGLDLSPYMAHRARQRLLKQGMVPRITRGKAQELPFADASFANVVATFPTEFILDPKTLVSVLRVLQPGGRLVVVVMGHLKGKGLLRHFVEWLYRVTAQREIPIPNPLERLETLGFDACWQEVTLDGATARLLVATCRSAPKGYSAGQL